MYMYVCICMYKYVCINMSIYQFCIDTQNNTNITHYLELSPIIEKIGVRIEGIDKGNLVGGVEEAALGLTNGQIATVLLLAFRWRSLLWIVI